MVGAWASTSCGSDGAGGSSTFWRLAVTSWLTVSPRLLAAQGHRTLRHTDAPTTVTATSPYLTASSMPVACASSEAATS